LGAFWARFKTHCIQYVALFIFLRSLTLALCLVCSFSFTSFAVSHSHFSVNYTHTHSHTHSHTHTHLWLGRVDAFSALIHTFPPLCPAMTALKRLLTPSLSLSLSHSLTHSPPWLCTLWFFCCLCLCLASFVIFIYV